jgi:hypothetical protein
LSPARLVRAVTLVALVCIDIWIAATVARAVGSGDHEGGVFWGAVGLLILLLAGLAYLTIRVAAELGIDSRRLRSHPLWRHGWKVALLPLFIHVPVALKYVCGTILCASLAVDLGLNVSEQRLRDWVGAAFGVGGVLNFLSEVAGIEGRAWHVLRVGVSLVFTVLLCAWLGSILVRRAAPAGHARSRRIAELS